MEYPQFKNKGEEIEFIVAKQKDIIASKCMNIKTADAVMYSAVATIDKDSQEKGASNSVESLLSSDKIVAKLVINTTKILDSHGDVHLDGIWKKSLQENKSLYLLQEHVMSFKNIISDEVKASTQTLTWKELGFKFTGDTQALVFDVVIDKNRNGFMFEQYAKGYVKNHSVGMRYVKIALAVNDSNYIAEKAVWDKYIEQVVNTKEVEEKGYFWAVTEAKAIEGSAVPVGSNIATPTMSVESKDNEAVNDTSKTEADLITSNEMSKDSKKISIYF